MKLIYTGRSPTDAHLLAALLEEQGIFRELRGEPLWIGHEPRLSKKVPVTTIWVRDEDESAAAEVVQGYQTSLNDAETWACPSCGDHSPRLFDECWRCGRPRDLVEPPPIRPTEEVAATDDGIPAAPPEAVSRWIPCPVDDETAVSVHPFREIVPWTMPWGTVLVTAICVVAWYGLSSEPDPQSDSAMMKWGWRSAEQIWDGAYWSLLTSAFLHADWPHLSGNLITFWMFGLRLEQAIGSVRWLVFVAASAVVSILFDLAWLGEHSYGASGVTNAAFGLFLVGSVKKRLYPWWITILLCLETLWHSTLFDLADTVQEAAGGALPEPIANVCHLAGLVFGFVVGMAFLQSHRRTAWKSVLVAMMITGCVPIVWSPWSTEWLIARGDAASNRNDLATALHYWGQAAENAPEDPRPHWKQAVVALLQNDLSLAMEAAEASVRKEEALLTRTLSTPGGGAEVVSPESNPPLPDVATPEAKPSREARRDSPAITGRSYLVRGRVHAVQGRFDQAEQDFTRSLTLVPDDPISLLDRGKARWRQAKWEDAYIDLTTALDQVPHDIETLLARGQLSQERAEAFAARNDLELALELASRAQDLNEQTAAAQLAMAHRLLGEPENALAFCQTAIEQSPDQGDFYRLKSNVELQLHNFAEARADADRALQLNPLSVDAWVARGDAMLGLERPQEAIENFTHAIQIHPRSVAAFRGRGLARHEKGQHEMALEDLNRAIQLNSRDAMAYSLRSLVHSALRHRRDAAADRQTAIALDPSLELPPESDEP